MGGETSKEKTKPTATGSLVNVTRLDPFILKLKEQCQGRPITEGNVMNMFPPEGSLLVSRLYQSISQKQGDLLENLSMILSDILLLKSVESQMNFYLALYAHESGKLVKEDCEELVHTAFTLFLINKNISHNSSETEKVTLFSVSSALSTASTLMEAGNYLRSNCSDLLVEMHRWLTIHITRPGMSKDVHDGPCQGEGQILNTACWWLLTCCLPTLYIDMIQIATPSLESEKQYLTPLYNSSEHGQSMNRFQHHILSYRGPTLTLVAFHSVVIAMALDTEWRESTESVGGVNCFVIQICSRFQTLEEGDGMVLFNVRSRNIPKGISIGRNRRCPVLFIESGMEEVTFMMKKYSLRKIEVWGCGGNAAKSDQLKQKERELRDSEKNLKVKRPGRWDDNPDRYLLELSGVKVYHSENG